jgi:hypothetical protein
MRLFKWTGTLLCLVGIGLTSLNVYPANIWFGFIGSAMWAWAGWKQDDYALFLVEFVAVLMYFFGLYLYIFNNLSKWGI